MHAIGSQKAPPLGQPAILRGISPKIPHILCTLQFDMPPGVPHFIRHILFLPSLYLMAPQRVRKTVTPAEAGVQNLLKALDSRLRGNDRKGWFLTSYEFITLGYWELSVGHWELGIRHWLPASLPARKAYRPEGRAYSSERHCPCRCPSSVPVCLDLSGRSSESVDRCLCAYHSVSTPS